MAATFHAKAIIEISGGTTNTIALTISAGDSIVVVGAYEVTGVTPTFKITDNTSIPIIVGPTTDLQGMEKFGVWLLQSAGSGNSDITVTFSSSVSYAGFYAWSFSGLPNPVLDKSAEGLTDPTTATLTSADEFAVEFSVSNGTITAIGAPWTSDGISPFNLWGGGHQVVTATTALTSNFTGDSDDWVFTFKSGVTDTNIISPQGNLALDKKIAINHVVNPATSIPIFLYPPP